jgi:hypothetical protein
MSFIGSLAAVKGINHSVRCTFIWCFLEGIDVHKPVI